MSWKLISSDQGIETGHIDSNGRMIFTGDLITYPKRVRAGAYVAGVGRIGKGYTKQERVRVIGFCHRVKTAWNKRMFVIDFIDVETLDRRSTFRLYRTDKTSIVK